MQLAAVILLDFFFFFIKTFDTINHIAICNKLAACGTLPQTVTWFQSQFCQLKALVGNSDSSSPARRLRGPRGSVLFVLYINDLLAALRHKGQELRVCTCLQVPLYISNNLFDIKVTSLRSQVFDSICEVWRLIQYISNLQLKYLPEWKVGKWGESIKFSCVK